jgi:hypothetical protein
MARDPRSRDELRRRLDEALGEEAADTLMEALPPLPWNELATKADLVDLKVDIDRVEERVLLRLDSLEHKITAVFRAELNTAITSQTRAMMISTFGTVVGVGSLVLAAAKIG